MLQLQDFTEVKLENFNVRAEHHGEALVPAIDLAFSWKTNNRALDMIHAELRTRLFIKLAQPRKVKEGDNEELELPVDDELPNVCFPLLKYPLKFEKEYQGYTCTVNYGLGGKSDIVLNLCRLKDVKVEPIEGGSVEIKWTISCAADITESISGKLSLQQQREISLKMLPPTDSAGQVMTEEDDEGGEWPFPGEGADKVADKAAKGKKSKKAAEPDATDLFVAAAKADEAAAPAKKAAAKKSSGKKAPAKKAAAKKKPAAKKAAKAKAAE